jgi:hypothetical protein
MTATARDGDAAETAPANRRAIPMTAIKLSAFLL